MIQSHFRVENICTQFETPGFIITDFQPKIINENKTVIIIQKLHRKNIKICVN